MKIQSLLRSRWSWKCLGKGFIQRVKMINSLHLGGHTFHTLENMRESPKGKMIGLGVP